MSFGYMFIAITSDCLVLPPCLLKVETVTLSASFLVNPAGIPIVTILLFLSIVVLRTSVVGIVSNIVRFELNMDIIALYSDGIITSETIKGCAVVSARPGPPGNVTKPAVKLVLSTISSYICFASLI